MDPSEPASQQLREGTQAEKEVEEMQAKRELEQVELQLGQPAMASPRRVVRLKFTKTTEEEVQEHPLQTLTPLSLSLSSPHFDIDSSSHQLRSPRTPVSVQGLPSAGRQRSIIRRLCLQADESQIQEGDPWFVLSAKWWNRWKDYVGYEDQEEEREGHAVGARVPPAIDNTHLIGEEQQGIKGPVYRLKTGLLEGQDYVLLQKEAWDAISTWYGGGPAIERYGVIVGDEAHSRGMVQLYPELEDGGEDGREEGAEVGQPQEAEPYSSPSSASFSPPPSASDSADEGALRRKPAVGPCGACGLTTSSNLRCTQCRVVFYCGRTCQLSHWKYHKALCQKEKEQPGILSDAAAQGRRGKAGLMNLGNTCFMNSALQCLSHAIPLTRHFLSGKFKEDLNESNPLGTGGRLAVAYEVLLKDLWFGRDSCVNPIQFKRAISQFAPQFVGYQQHDAHDLLSYLLDGLHEDLNRVREKPYVEAQEADGKPDAVAAAEAWERHLLRNRSVITERFQGQFKSTVICPVCGKISITFDPYSYLFMEMGLRQERKVEVTVVRDRQHFLLSQSYQDRLSELCGIPPDQLVLADIYNNSIYQIFDPRRPLSKIREDDVLIAYEVPPESGGRKIVLLQQYPDRNGELTPFGQPLLFVLNPEDSVKDLYSSVWRQIQRFLKLSPEDSPDELLAALKLSFVDENFNTTGREEELSLKVSKPIGELFPSGLTFLSLNWLSPLKEHLDPAKVEAREDHSSVQLAGKDTRTSIRLEDCFRRFTSPEVLDKDNPWYCPSCKEHRQATKKMELWRLPDILIIGLKRFEYNNRFYREKLNTLVHFPLEGLDLSSFVLHPDEKSSVYDCFAVSNHYGNMAFGHYTAFARDINGAGDGEWFYFDDGSVARVSAERVASSAAYVLFYQRRESSADEVANK